MFLWCQWFFVQCVQRFPSFGTPFALIDRPWRWLNHELFPNWCRKGRTRLVRRLRPTIPHLGRVLLGHFPLTLCFDPKFWQGRNHRPHPIFRYRDFVRCEAIAALLAAFVFAVSDPGNAFCLLLLLLHFANHGHIFPVNRLKVKCKR